MPTDNSGRTVPFFNYSFLYASRQEQFIKILQDVGSRGAFITQKDLADFEQHLATFTGAKYAVGVANATDALEMLLAAAGIGFGDEVIFCTHTMVATASAIHVNGATPVPVEVGADHLIDPASIEQAITPRTRAIMPTQLNGRTCDMDAVQAIAEQHDLLVIEDSAQALGSRFKDRHAGTFGAGGCISFYPAKLLGCLGDGGAVLCNDEETYKKILLMRDHGRNPETGDVDVWGRNSRLDNLQAAFLDMQFKEYEQVISRRREIARIYQERLGKLEQLVLPPPPDSDPDHFDVFQNYEIEAEQRDALKQYLAEHGIGTLIQWGGKAVHQFKKLGFTQSLPYTEKLFERMLMLPMNMSLSDDDVHYVSDQIVKFYS
ncbi:MAG: DegT/DnrJ/EryC1/StrS family aminotransferase [Candidatus Electrothrix sp. AW3_4]|nr:DegT/DnrJ/EryC1/StrS family aminotransferase [Candidatus Electrothrix gigas]